MIQQNYAIFISLIIFINLISLNFRLKDKQPVSKKLLFSECYYLMLLNSQTKNKKAEINLSDEEQLIKNEDLNELISKAIATNNYRLAIRYYYLLILKKLAAKDLIDWQQDKTNEDYLKEIESNDLKASFKRSTVLYDFIWYGNITIDSLEFSKAQAEFELFKDRI